MVLQHGINHVRSQRSRGASLAGSASVAGVLQQNTRISSAQYMLRQDPCWNCHHVDAMPPRMCRAGMRMTYVTRRAKSLRHGCRQVKLRESWQPKPKDRCSIKAGRHAKATGRAASRREHTATFRHHGPFRHLTISIHAESMRNKSNCEPR